MNTIIRALTHADHSESDDRQDMDMLEFMLGSTLDWKYTARFAVQAASNRHWDP